MAAGYLADLEGLITKVKGYRDLEAELADDPMRSYERRDESDVQWGRLNRALVLLEVAHETLTRPIAPEPPPKAENA